MDSVINNITHTVSGVSIYWLNDSANEVAAHLIVRASHQANFGYKLQNSGAQPKVSFDG